MSIRRDRINRKRNSRVLGLVIVSLFAVAAVLIIYSIIVVVRSFTSGAAPEVTVPNLAGLTVEERDIADLDHALAGTTRSDILQVYSNLRQGSENHKTAFLRQLGR